MQNEQDDITQLLENSNNDYQEEIKVETNKSQPKIKIFKKFAIKDIVFLAIMAACMLVTGGIMPLVVHVPVFGIIQLALALQFSIFPTVGLMKVRKVGSIFFMSLCCGIFFAFMYLPMFVCIMICALVTELINILIFRGYDKDAAVIVSGAIYFPCTLPLLYVYYNFLYSFTGEEGEAVNALVGANAGAAVGISFAVIAITILGAFVGYLVSKELIRVGVMKK
ncbi:MAG: MptD family putative ECF transporter S component [Clostridia bacterium]|nr:MptD family putative ECF transporter S component [Clostridia bacterium]